MKSSQVELYNVTDKKSHLFAYEPDLCYTEIVLKQVSPSTPVQLCNQCGSPLIKLQKKTQALPGQKFPITITTFKCSNKECQARIDKDKAERIKKQLERSEKKQHHTV